MKTAKQQLKVVPRRTSDPLSDVYRFPLPGNLTLARRVTVLDFPISAPFPIQRVYWLHNLNPLEIRGHHAHYKLEQLMVAVNGSIEIELDNGRERRTEVLDRATEALYVPPGLWRRIRARELHSTLVVFASASFDEADYIRDYDRFVEFAAQAHGVTTPKKSR
jgi:mannose-6-phosphate isomerase-like protein (cupin superfamily)